LTALPADVLGIAPEYTTVAIAIAPARLGARITSLTDYTAVR
jgi:hypothetical protein